MDVFDDPVFPLMEHMTVKSMRAYLARKRSIILPVGIIEQHGYHLPLITDALIASETARRIGQRSQTLVGPVITQSFSGGGLPGTINVSPSVMSLVVNDILISLVSQGFRNIYLWLCHGGSENSRALDDAIRLLLRLNPAFHDTLVAIMPIWKFDTHPEGWGKAVREGDWHAGRIETSMMLALAPDLVRLTDIALDPEPLLGEQIAHPDNYQQAEKIVDDPVVVPRMSQRAEIEVGVMGFPEQASRGLGVELVDNIVSNAATKIQELEQRGDGAYKRVAFVPEPLIF